MGPRGARRCRQTNSISGRRASAETIFLSTGPAAWVSSAIGLMASGQSRRMGIQQRTLKGDEPIVQGDLAQAAREHVSRMLPLTREEGAFYKTGFAVLHEGALANWLLFQWWTHRDVWCQLLSYSNSDDPLTFMHSTRPVRACVYETAIIWYEQKSWIRHILNGSPDRRAYLEDAMQNEYC